MKKACLDEVFSESIEIEVPFGEGITTKLLETICEPYNISVRKGKANYWFLSAEKSIDFFWLGCNIQKDISNAI